MKSSLAKAATQARSIVHRTRGHSQGSITRLVSPSDVGELIKPFVFLDYFDIDPQRMPNIGFHPHSGIATVTVVLEGQISYEETSGTRASSIPAGSNGCAQAVASGIPEVLREGARQGLSAWIALPPEMENIASEARYLGREHFQSSGPARVILGRLGEAASKVPAPAVMNYLDVALKKGEKWRYDPPGKHTVAWIAVHRGKLATPEIVDRASWRCSRSRTLPSNSKRSKTRASSWVRPSSIRTSSRSACTPFTRASARSSRAKRKSRR